MAEAPRPSARSGADRGSWLSTIARQRELSLLAIMFVLGGLVSLAAPQFLTVANLTNVAIPASIIAVAAIGQAVVIITRNVDLSVEAIIGLVAYAVARSMELQALDATGAIVFGILLGLVLGMVNGTIVTVLKVPAIVATLGTLSIFRGIDYLVAGPHQVPVAALPPALRRKPRSRTILGIPLFVLIAVVIAAIGTVLLRWTRFGRQIYAVGSNPEAAAILGIPSRLGRVRGLRRVRHAGRRGRRHVGQRIRDDQRDDGHGRGARHRRRGGGRWRGDLRRVGHGRRGGARRPLPRLHRQWPRPRRPVAVLAPGHLRRGHPALAVSADAVLSRRLLRATAERRIR